MDLNLLKEELREAEAAFKHAGGRGVELAERIDELREQLEHGLDNSVNCYFCGEFFRDKECIPADEYNNDDGGSICKECLKKESKTGEVY